MHEGKDSSQRENRNLRNQSGHPYVEVQETGTVLNEYFSSVYTMEKDMKTWELGTVDGGVLRAVCIMIKEMINVPSHMMADKYPGPDKIYPSTLWEAREDIVGPLAKI